MFPLYLRLTLKFFIISFVIGCGSSNWKQFHADGQNQGSISVNTLKTLTPKWNAPINVGQVSYSSPVIDDDGTIYIGTVDGVLVAVDKKGSIKWRFETSTQSRLNFINPTIVSSAAIGMNNDIYFIVSFMTPSSSDDVHDIRSALVHLNNDGTLACSYTLDVRPLHLPSWTTSSPKIVHLNSKDFILIANQGILYVFDSNCQLITQQDNLNCSGGVNAGTPTTLDYDKLSEFYNGPYIFQSWHNMNDASYWIDPSIAVVTKIGNEELSKPIVIVATNKCGLQAWDWTPPPNPSLHLKWNRSGDENTFYSSPAVSTAGELILGFREGYLVSKDVMTGNDNWLFKIPSQEPVLASTSFYAGSLHIFAVSLNNIYVVDNNKVLLNSFHLPGETVSSPAISYDRVYVSSKGGFHSLATDLSTIASEAFPGGMSSPAIDKDGSIYFVSSDGRLMAYKGP